MPLACYLTVQKTNQSRPFLVTFVQNKTNSDREKRKFLSITSRQILCLWTVESPSIVENICAKKKHRKSRTLERRVLLLWTRRNKREIEFFLSIWVWLSLHVWTFPLNDLFEFRSLEILKNSTNSIEDQHFLRFDQLGARLLKLANHQIKIDFCVSRIKASAISTRSFVITIRCVIFMINN